MQTSDISQRTQGYADGKLLERAKANNILAQLGGVRPLPKNKGLTIIARRYNKLDSTPQVLQEGVTPTGKTSTKTDVYGQLRQLGDWVGFTDVIQDTHEDPVLNEHLAMLAEQAPEMYDKFYAGILKAGTNVVYANGSARNAVNTAISDTIVQKITRVLERQEAKRLREIVQAGPAIATVPIPPAFVAACHCDFRKDLEALTGWVPVHKYPNQNGLLEGEAGSVGLLRVVFDNNLTPWADAGGSKGSMISTSGTYADVYPFLVFGKDAFDTVPLGGKGSIKTLINNPKAVNGDELAQRGSIGWKGYTTAIITNDLWMVRLEAACTNL